MKKLRYLFPLIMLITLINCNNDGSTDKPKWQEIDPLLAYPDFTYNGLKPSCAACPAYTDISGESSPAANPSFKFFYKEGESNNLVVYFQGGGACWATENCLYEHTYSEELQFFETTDYLEQISSGSARSLGYGGIFDLAEDSNPFKDWDMVYIPYCTGDLHAGSNDYDYSSVPSVPTANLYDQYNNTPQTIRHRGEVNFRAVLRWIIDTRNMGSADKILVTGISGGCYGAMFNYSPVCEAFPDSIVYLLGDAGNGVVPAGFLGTVADKWGLEFPPLSEFSGSDFNSITISDFYSTLANHYSGSRVAQYTTKWDNTQSWFYNIMLGDTINYPATWGGEDDSTPVLIHTGGAWADVISDWSNSMITIRNDTASLSTQGNYRSYVAAGHDHTILMSTKFYTEDSGGTSFVQWVSDFISGVLPANEECTLCDPVTKGGGKKLYMH